MQNPRRDNLRTLPTCPSVLIPFQQRLYALPLLELSVNVEIHVATAFVKVKGVWRNVAKYKVGCWLLGMCVRVAFVCAAVCLNSILLGAQRTFH